MRFLLAAAMCCAVPVFAAELALHQCDEKRASCNDDCTLSHGSSTKDAARAKLAKCLAHCDNRDKSCRERYFDAQQAKTNPPKKVEPPPPITAKKAEPVAAVPPPLPPAPAAKKATPAPAPEKKKERPLDEWDAE